MTITFHAPRTSSAARSLAAATGLALALVLSATPNAALAQDKPSAAPVQAEVVRTPNLDGGAWREAYDKAGRPVIAVYCGWAADAHQARSPEDTILNSDPSSLTMRLREALQLELDDPAADPEFVDLNATRAALTRLQGTFDLRRDREAAKMLGVEAGANLIILISLNGDATNGSPTGGSLSVIDANRGRSVGRPIPFEWVYETDLVGIRSMAKRLAERLIEDLSARVRSARPVAVRLMGDAASETRAVASLRRQLLAIGGVESVRPGQSVGGRRDASRELTITTSLDPLDLELSIAESLEAIGFGIEPVKTEGDALIFRTRFQGLPAAAPVATAPAAPASAPTAPFVDRAIEIEAAAAPAVATEPARMPSTLPGIRQREMTREDCEIDLLDPDSVDGQTLRSDMQARYVLAGSPTVAVIINRSAMSREIERATDRLREDRLSPEQVIVWQITGLGTNTTNLPGGQPTFSAELEEFQTINTLGIHSQTLESMMYERLGTGTIDSAGLGFKLVDGATVREKLKALIATSASPLAERDIVKTIREAKIADVVIVGRAAVEKSEGRTLALYDFRLVGPEDALWAQATGLSSALSVSTGLGSIEDLADVAVSRLGCGLLETWRRSPR
jgi:hypothetical protein